MLWAMLMIERTRALSLASVSMSLTNDRSIFTECTGKSFR